VKSIEPDGYILRDFTVYVIELFINILYHLLTQNTSLLSEAFLEKGQLFILEPVYWEIWGPYRKISLTNFVEVLGDFGYVVDLMTEVKLLNI